MLVRATACALVLLLAASAAAQAQRETVSIPRTHKGKPVTIKGDLMLPAGTAKVPAMIVHHGSGGISDRRGNGAMRASSSSSGVAALVLDSFTGRGVTSTVSNQSAVTNTDMLEDAFAALSRLSAACPDRRRAHRHHRLLQGWVGGAARRAQTARRPHPAGRACALPCTCRSTPPAARTTTSRRRPVRPSICCLAAPIPMRAWRRARSMRVFSRPKAPTSRRRCIPAPGTGSTAARPTPLRPARTTAAVCSIEQPDGTWKERMSGLVTHVPVAAW